MSLPTAGTPPHRRQSPDALTMTHRKPKSLMHNLGQFFGHVAKGIKTPARPGKSAHEVRRQVEERQETGPSGERITVRRTTVEEIEIQPPRPTDNHAEQDRP